MEFTTVMGRTTHRKRLEAIGREKEKKEIIDRLMLLPSEKSLAPVPVPVPVPVIAIVGIAGIGKTTLARLVCEDEQVKTRFGSPIKVPCMHEAFDVESIAKRVTEESAARGSKSKRHLLVVLDDLRAEIRDESLIAKLTEDGMSVAAVLVTTRRISSLSKATYGLHLQGLDEKQSRFLLQQHASDDDSISSLLKDGEISKIVGKCRGVPKAIITMARLLNPRGGAAGSRVGAELNELFLSSLKSIYYDDLPTVQHKECFAYMSLFPEGYLVDAADRLIPLWMAEGFLVTTPSVPSSSSLEEIGRQHLNDFLERCIFQDVEKDEDGVVRSCRMHPLMLDLARFVAKGENIIITTATDPDNYMHEHDKVLRASFDFRLPFWCQIPDSLFEKAKKLRSILLQTRTESSSVLQEMKMSESTCDKICTTFKSLRVLDLHDLGIKVVPSTVGKLKNLRYLDLSHNNMEKLPGSITRLFHLQTLKLSQCHFLKELPKDLKSLSKLRHLDIEGCLSITHMPLGMKMLTSLQTLSCFAVSKNNCMGGLDELADLNNLRGHLEILYLERLKFHAPAHYLKQKQHLQRLTLRWDQDDDDDDDDDDEGSHPNEEKSLEVLEPHPNLKVLHVMGYKGGKFSNWLTSLRSLVKFSLYNCPRCQFLPPLDQLPCLKILELRRLYSLKFIAENTGTLSSFSIATPTAQFFPSLKELTIWDCPNLESWWETGNNVKRPIFSCISILRVQYCPKLTCMPLYPGLDEMLVLVDSSVKPMRDTIHYRTEEAFVPFSKLKSMLIASIEQSPPEEWLKKFTSLENLHIRECSHLESLPQGFKHLSSLRNLTIENCPILDLDRSSDEWEGLRNLRTFIVREIPELKSLPSGLENVTSLQEIRLYDCPGLTSLPESIGNLTSLGRLVICKCCSLDSLPKGMVKLKSLHTLIIVDCPLLLPRCQQETGDDWPQIAHIKNILVKQTNEGLGLENSRLLL